MIGEQIKERTPQFTTLFQWCDWVSENWIHPLGSDEFQVHARAKLTEEVDELSKAMKAGVEADIELELGDVLWTSTAVCINEGAVYDDPSLEEIDERALQGDIIWSPLSLSETDSLSDYQVTTLIKNGDLETTVAVLKKLASILGKSSSYIHSQRPALNCKNGKHQTFTSAYLGTKYTRLVTSYEQILLLVSFISQTKLNLSLSDIMLSNQEKLNSRIENGTPITKLPSENN